MAEDDPDDTEGSVISSAQEDSLMLPIALDASTDLGVQKWALVPEEALMTYLGFLEGRPALFAEWRSKRGGDGSNWKTIKDIPVGDREAIVLLWHQAVAVAALTEAFWTEHAVDEGVPGVLLADNVGLGKTVELMGLIAMIIQTRMGEDNSSGVRANILSESDQRPRVLVVPRSTRQLPVFARESLGHPLRGPRSLSRSLPSFARSPHRVRR